MHEFLKEKLKESNYSANEIDNIVNELTCDKHASFRINRNKINKEKIVNLLNDKKISYELNDEFIDAIILTNAVTKNGVTIDKGSNVIIEDLDIYKNGEIYMQSLSSMKPVYMLSPNPSENILDMCAAPGGKTTMIASITNNKANVTAIELHKDRYERLLFNIKKQSANVYAIQKNAIDLDENLKFDKILLDAPCTGSGTFDLQNENYLKYFTDILIEKVVKTQRKLILKASKLLREKGTLIYSTCSLLKKENEDMVSFAKNKGFKLNGDVIKIMPNKYFEGFFIARLIKV